MGVFSLRVNGMGAMCSVFRAVEQRGSGKFWTERWRWMGEKEAGYARLKAG